MTPKFSVGEEVWVCPADRGSFRTRVTAIRNRFGSNEYTVSGVVFWVYESELRAVSPLELLAEQAS